MVLLKNDKGGRIFFSSYLHSCPKACLKSQVWLENEGRLGLPEQNLQCELELQTRCGDLCWVDSVDENN